jgi:hypothetical protein
MAFSFHRHILPSIDIGALNRCGVQDLRVETILQHQLRDLMFDSYRRWEFDLSSKPVPKHRNQRRKNGVLDDARLDWQVDQ